MQWKLLFPAHLEAAGVVEGEQSYLSRAIHPCGFLGDFNTLYLVSLAVTYF